MTILNNKEKGDAIIPDSREYFDQVLNVNSIVLKTDKNGIIQYINAFGLTFFGYLSEELLGRHVMTIVPKVEQGTGRDLDLLVTNIFRAPEEYVSVVNENIRKDGKSVWVTWTNKAILDEHGVVQGILAVGNDITALKEAEEALLRSGERYRSLLHTAMDGFWLVDMQGRLLEVNETYCQMSGYSEQELLAMQVADLECKETAEEVSVHLQNVMMRGQHRFESQHRNKNGDVLDIEVSVQYRRDDGGRFVCFLRDVTGQKKVRSDLLKRKKLFRDFFESNPVATIITSPSGVVHMINPAFSRASGFSAEEVIGRTSHELGFWRDPADRDRMVRAIMEHGGIDNLEASFYAKNERPMTLLVSSRTVEHEGEQRILSTLVDVTEQRTLEEDQRKLEQAKSDFVRIAAHELQTPLVAIFGYAELLEDTGRLYSAEQQKQYAEVILRNAEILSRLVNDLLDVERAQFGHSLSIFKRKVSFAKLIKRVIASLTPIYPEYRFILAHENSLPEIMHIDEDRIAQVLSNILSNALKYSPGGGVVEVTTSTEGNSVTTSIKDHGLGMTPEQVERVFEVFYRAHPENPQVAGFGLGMNIVRKIVEDHGGGVSISSHQGQGTTVAFTLPIE